MKVHTFKEFRANMSKILKEAGDGIVQFTRLGDVYEVKKVRTSENEVKKVKKSLKAVEKKIVEDPNWGYNEVKAVTVSTSTVVQEAENILSEREFVPVHKMDGFNKYSCKCKKVEG